MSIMHVGDSILDATVVAKINKIGAFLSTSRHETHSSMENTYQISDMILM